MRKKFFITPKAVKIATGIFVSTLVVAGSLSMFYLSNQTFSYSKSLKSNKRLAEAKGVFQSEGDYLRVANSPTNFAKRVILRHAFQVAVSNNLIGRTEVNDVEVGQFIRDFNQQPESKEVESSVPEQDRMVRELDPLIVAILTKTDDFGYAEPGDFELKKQTLSCLSTICDNMDGQGSFEGMMTRELLTEKILQRVFSFQVKTAAPASMKNELIEATVPILKKRLDLPYMFRFEHLRTQKLIDVSLGIGRIEPHSEFYQPTKPFSTANRLVLSIPGVSDAWESRFHKAFADILIRLEEPNPNESIIMGEAMDAITRTNTVNKGYLDQFGFKDAVFSPAYRHKNWYLFHIDKERKNISNTG